MGGLLSGVDQSLALTGFALALGIGFVKFWLCCRFRILKTIVRRVWAFHSGIDTSEDVPDSFSESSNLELALPCSGVSLPLKLVRVEWVHSKVSVSHRRLVVVLLSISASRRGCEEVSRNNILI
jgi:hypothetical protein